MKGAVPAKVLHEECATVLSLEEFNRLWCSLVDFITVYSKEDIRVTFKDGTEIKA